MHKTLGDHHLRRCSSAQIVDTLSEESVGRLTRSKRHGQTRQAGGRTWRKATSLAIKSLLAQAARSNLSSQAALLEPNKGMQTTKHSSNLGNQPLGTQRTTPAVLKAIAARQYRESWQRLHSATTRKGGTKIRFSLTTARLI